MRTSLIIVGIKLVSVEAGVDSISNTFLEDVCLEGGGIIRVVTFCLTELSGSKISIDSE